MHLIEIYKNVGVFSRATRLVQKLLDKNKNKCFSQKFEMGISPLFPSSDQKNPSAIETSMLELTLHECFGKI